MIKTFTNEVMIVNDTTGEINFIDTLEDFYKVTYKACHDFIEDFDGNWTSDTSDARDAIDDLPLQDQAKWLLGDCLSDGDFGNILHMTPKAEYIGVIEIDG